jgi:hypothetical protein
MKKTSQSLFHGFVGGLGWAIGASFGFAVLIAITSYIFTLLGGLPLIGNFIGQIVKHTQNYLNNAPNIK